MLKATVFHLIVLICKFWSISIYHKGAALQGWGYWVEPSRFDLKLHGSASLLYI